MIADANAVVERPIIPREQRLSLLAGVAGFAKLPAEALNELTRIMREERFAAGSVVVAEGDAGDRLFVIAEGQAEVSAKAASASAVPLALLDAGEIFGEIALLAPDAQRQASVTALTPLVCLTLSGEDFKRILSQHPEAKTIFAQIAEDLLETKFLKQASPFAKLEPARLRGLAARLEPVRFNAGDTIIQQGERGDSCYLVRAGRVEVIASGANNSERRLATLGVGALFGEAALLTDAPRNASVRAVEPTELLALRRADLLEAMSQEQRIVGQMIELIHLRARPRRAANVTAHERTNPDGEAITILKNPERGAYYRLSAEGFFIWQRLDGERSLRDLTLDYLSRFKIFAPQMIAEVIAGLAAAGFVETKSLRADVMEKAFRPAWWQRLVLGARRILEWQWAAGGIDKHVTRAYRAGIFLLYTRTAQIVFAALTLAGLVAFFLTSGRAGEALRGAQNAKLYLFFIPAYLFALLLHEAGHAFTVKAFGYEVPRAGIGWYWFGPIAFVDTSDMWLAGRWARIAVSLAGPYTNLILAGIAALAAWWTTNPIVTVALWQFAFASYVMVLFNFNPLMEYDGYYVLMDWLERPNLRARSLRWLGGELPKSLRAGSSLREHYFDLIYGASSVLYVLLMGIITLVAYRLLVQDWMARVMSPSVAAALAWLLGASVVLLSVLCVTGEIRGARNRAIGTSNEGSY
jgi:putative peptide zinc metalloprotease protein